MKRMLFAVALASALFGASVSAAPKTQASIILNQPSTARFASSTAWSPALGDTVSFTSVFPDSLSKYGVSIQVNCYQDGALVFVTAGYFDRSFLLGGTTSPWLDRGGAATCHADLYYWSTSGTKYNQLASTEFDVVG